MADKTIWDYPTLATADPNDLILMASDEETYNMKVETLKNAMGEAASKPPIIRNEKWYVWSAANNDYVDTGVRATGPAAGFGTVSATVDSNTGTPSIDITTSGSDTAKNIAFAFHNMKGETGDVTPAAQQAATNAQNAATNAASSASSASASQQAAAQSAQEAANILSTVLPKANVYNALDKTSEGYALDARQGKTLNDAKLDKANVYNGVDQTGAGYALDARQGKMLNDKANTNTQNISAIQFGLAIIVNGDSATMAVPVNGYAYIKNNTHGLVEGLYVNTSATAFPVSGGTANSGVFSPASSDGGALNISKAKTLTGTMGAVNVDTKVVNYPSGYTLNNCYVASMYMLHGNAKYPLPNASATVHMEADGIYVYSTVASYAGMDVVIKLMQE